jgi:hypothetical protein
MGDIEAANQNAVVVADTPKENLGCCGRFRADFQLDFFQRTDANGKILDLERSFCASERTLWVLLPKLVFFALTVADVISGLVTTRYPRFWMAYLSNWSLIYATIYISLSFFVSLGWSSLLFIKMTWAMFSIAIVHQILVFFLFWFLEYDSDYDLDYYTIMTHGGVALCVVLDGLIVNRTPVRIKHWFPTFAMSVLYTIWNIIHSYVVEENPWIDDDDQIYIYSALNWRDDFVQAAVTIGIVILFVSPVFHLIIWRLSLCSRRYEEEEEEDPAKNNGPPAGEEQEEVEETAPSATVY